MSIWVYAALLLLPLLWIGRCIHSLSTRQPCRGACTATVLTLLGFLLVSPRLIAMVEKQALPALSPLPEDVSFFETTAGTALMFGAIFFVVAGAIFLMARFLR